MIDQRNTLKKAIDMALKKLEITPRRLATLIRHYLERIYAGSASKRITASVTNNIKVMNTPNVSWGKFLLLLAAIRCVKVDVKFTLHFSEEDGIDPIEINIEHDL